MLPRQRLTTTFQHCASSRTGLVMSISTGVVINDMRSSVDNDTLVDGYLRYLNHRSQQDTNYLCNANSRPPKTTSSAYRPSTQNAFTMAAKNKTWQPSNGILFGHAKTVTGNAAPTIGGKHSRDFSTTARQCSQLKPLSPKARPYNPQQRTDRLFMSEEDGNNGLRDDEEEDIGELLAQSELSGKGFDKCSVDGAGPIRKPQQLSDRKVMYRAPKAKRPTKTRTKVRGIDT